MDKEEEEHSSTKNEFKMERMHAAKECKASSVLNKFKEMEQKIANGEDLDEDKREWGNVVWLCNCQFPAIFHGENLEMFDTFILLRLFVL